MLAPVLDDISKQIIEQLQQDGRRSYASIGQAVGLSEAAVRQRVQRLVEAGAMQIVAVTDPMTLGFRRQTMIGIRCSGELEQVADQLAAMDEIDYVVITAGSFDLLIEVVCEDDDQLLEILGRVRAIPSVTSDRDVRVPETAQADLLLGDQMTTPSSPSQHLATTRRSRQRPSATCGCTSPGCARTPTTTCRSSCAARASTSTTTAASAIWTGWPGCSSARSGTAARRSPRPAARQGGELAYFPLWSYANPRAIELAQRLADLAPGDLNRVWFTSSGSEAVESAWKLAKQYFKAIGQPGRYKVISRDIAYHGTSMGALAITGLPAIKEPFEPLPPGGVRVPNTNFYRAPAFVADDVTAFGAWAADEIERAILREGPESVAAVFLEPVQNSGGCFPPPPGYFQRVREICDRYGVLLVSDEVICAFGRLGYYFGSERYGYQPDVITFAKGVTSGYSPLGGMLASDRLMEPFAEGSATFLHGVTFAGHPVSCAVALANLDVFEKEDLLGNVRANEAAFRATLEKLLDLPIVGDVRGDGYFYGIELVKDKATRETFDDDESERLLRGFLSHALFDAGLICRADDRGDPVIQLSPPLTCTQEHFDEMEQILRSVLTQAWSRL